jgi:hypothetical protein
MDEQKNGVSKKAVVKKGAKISALAVALFIFILLLLFVLGIIVDRYFLAPTHL